MLEVLEMSVGNSPAWISGLFGNCSYRSLAEGRREDQCNKTKHIKHIKPHHTYQTTILQLSQIVQMLLGISVAARNAAGLGCFVDVEAERMNFGTRRKDAQTGRQESYLYYKVGGHRY